MPDSNRKIELVTVMESGALVFRRRRQLRILRAQELAFADSCTFFFCVGDPDHGLWLVAQLPFLKKITFGGVYMTDPVAPTFSDSKLTGRVL